MSDLPNQDRGVGMTDVYAFDIDAVNAQATILYNRLEQMGKAKDFPMIGKFVKYPKHWRHGIATMMQLGEDTSEAKMEIIKLLYGGYTGVEIPPMIKLQTEFREVK